MKKLLILILALAMALTVFACGGKKNEGNGGGNTTPSTSEGESGGLPDVNYGGRNFRISMYESGSYEFYIAEDSSDNLKNSLYVRNCAVEDTFGVKIKPVYAAQTGELFAQTDEIILSISTEQDEYDLVAPSVVTTGVLITEGYLRDWLQNKYNNFDASYWVKTINDEFTLDGHLYTAVGSTNVSSLLCVYAMMYNRTLGDNNGLTEQVYSAIRSGDWTIDYFINLISNFHQEDGGPFAVDDIYGFQAEALTNADMWTFAFDIPMLEHDEEDTLVLAFGQGEYREKLSTAADKILDLYWNTTGSLCHLEAGAEINNFKAGKALFATINFKQLFNTVKDMEDEYSVLPYPKFDENQDQYLCSMMDGYTLLGIPTSAPDIEFTSIITEALNIEAEKTMYPAYYTQSLQVKYQTDPDAIEMIEKLMAGRRADLGVVFNSNLNYLSMLFRQTLRDKNNNLLWRLDGRVTDMIESVANIVVKYREHAE